MGRWCVWLFAATLVATAFDRRPAGAQARATPAASRAGTTDRPIPYDSFGTSSFLARLNPYRPRPIRQLELQNSPRLLDLVRSGHLSLSLSDALTLAIENNLDLAVQRYVRPIAQADILRAASGQAARGTPGALLPSGLSAGALGVGVNQAAGPGGIGSAGGISGGGGAVSVPQVGTFDPSVSMSSSIDHTVAPLNSVVVAGVPNVTTTSTAGGMNYTQLFPQGGSVTLTVNGIAQNSTQQSLLFNPAVVTRVAAGFNQPLLSGFGFLTNKRFLMVAAHNLQTADELFRAQVTTIVDQVESAYWDLVASHEAIATAERARDAAVQLVEETKVRVEVGTAAAIDIVSAEAAAASAERDLIVARTSHQLLGEQLKTLLSKEPSVDLDAVEIDVLDRLPDPAASPVPDLQHAVETALDRRPELKAARQDLGNQDISVRFTRNGLLPNVSAFGLYAGSGLTGDTLRLANGLGTSLSQAFGSTYPEYAAGLSATIPIRNRSAQADNLRARLEEQQLNVRLQQLMQRIRLEVRQAVIGLIQGRAQVESAHEAARLAERIAGAERDKLELGYSTPYDVILRERDLLSARQAEVAAAAAFAKGLVELSRATGTSLERNGITLTDAFNGTMLTSLPPSQFDAATMRPEP